MKNWFNFKPSFDKTLENGLIKKVTEHYLVDALSFTEAEARGIEETKPYVSGEFSVSNITRAHYAEIFFNDSGDRWYKAKVKYIHLDEKTGAEKATCVNMLAQASDFDDAVHVLKKGMEGTMADWELVSMSDTTILDVFPYSTKGGE